MFLSMEQLDAGLAAIENSPKDAGEIRLIVCRPGVNERKELAVAELDLKLGLIGDNWFSRDYKTAANPEMQLNLMNSRAIALIAQTEDRWKLAGDQFYVDFDLSPKNLPPGSQLKLGDAIIEITAVPHLGCKKFMDRYGKDAFLWVNSKRGKSLNLRGINAKIIQAGMVKKGQIIEKINPGE